MKCNAKWQIEFIYTGILSTQRYPIDVGTCVLKPGHEGNHKARTKSNVNNTVAYLEW